MSEPAKQVAAIVGAGPNLGAATARTFGSHGFAAGLVARDRFQVVVERDG
jgi:NADP-dependent 3-hydroxy acid dehydrogenase YdfG